MAFGIICSYDLIFDKDFIQKHQIEYGDWNVYLPFYYKFIEEANAQMYSTSILNVEENSYLDSIFTLENIDYSLSLLPDY